MTSYHKLHKQTPAGGICTKIPAQGDVVESWGGVWGWENCREGWELFGASVFVFSPSSAMGAKSCMWESDQRKKGKEDEHGVKAVCAKIWQVSLTMSSHKKEYLLDYLPGFCGFDHCTLSSHRVYVILNSLFILFSISSATHVMAMLYLTDSVLIIS